MPPAKRTGRTDTIEELRDIERGCRALSRKCEVMRRIRKDIGPPPLRRNPAGFVGLSRVIVGQQLSIASASAIWARLEQSITPFTHENLALASDDDLRATGLSRPKIRTLRALATAISCGHLHLENLHHLNETEVADALVAVKGIGPWTADIYIMFCLGRRDAFAPGDLALQEAVRLLGLSEHRPSPDDITEIAERWRPWRAVAARMLWAYYGRARNRQSNQSQEPL